MRTVVLSTGDTALSTDMDGLARMAQRGQVGPLTQTPHQRAAAPRSGWLTDDDFLPAPEIASIGLALIQNCDELTLLKDATIEFRWKRKGGKSAGKDVYGKCVKTSGPLRHFARCDFLIWIAADHVRESGFTNVQLEALVFHELNHIGAEMDEDEASDSYGEMTFGVRAHEFAGFRSEITRYGLWQMDLEKMGESVTQLKLGDI